MYHTYQCNVSINHLYRSINPFINIAFSVPICTSLYLYISKYKSIYIFIC